MIQFTLPETLACPEVSLMTGNSANVTATVLWTVLNTHTHTVYIHSASSLDKIGFLTKPSL